MQQQKKTPCTTRYESLTCLRTVLAKTQPVGRVQAGASSEILPAATIVFASLDSSIKEKERHDGERRRAQSFQVTLRTVLLSFVAFSRAIIAIITNDRITQVHVVIDLQQNIQLMIISGKKLKLKKIIAETLSLGRAMQSCYCAIA